MPSWLTIKTNLKKVWTWTKHNWYVPVVIVYTLVLWFVFRRKEGAYAVLEARNESYRKQLDVINESHRKELEKRDEILKKYNEVMDQIEKDYAEKNEDLTTKKRNDVKDLVEKHHEDPDALARLLAEKYGLTYLTPEEADKERRLSM